MRWEQRLKAPDGKTSTSRLELGHCPCVGHILLTMWFIGPTVLFFFETEFHVKFYKLCYFNTTFLLKKIRRYCLFETRFSNGNHQQCPGVPRSGPAPRPQGAQLPHPKKLAFSTPTLHSQLLRFEYSATLYLLSKQFPRGPFTHPHAIPWSEGGFEPSQPISLVQSQVPSSRLVPKLSLSSTRSGQS